MRCVVLIAVMWMACCAFAAERSPHVVFMIGEDGYDSARTLPAFAQQHLTPRGIRSSFAVAKKGDPNNFHGLEQLRDADLLVMCVRRRTPPQAQMKLIREHFNAGKPLIALRPSSHAFALRGGEAPEGHVQWPDFDAQVLGARYAFDHGNRGEFVTTIAPGSADHPILRDFNGFELRSPGPMYRQADFAEDVTVLLTGVAVDKSGRQVTEPIAWSRQIGGSRIFYTSLGQASDFALPSFNQLLLNAVIWALGERRQ